MPRLQVDRDGTLASTGLIDVARGRVKHAEHGNYAVGLTVRASNVTLAGSNVVDVHADAARPFTDLRALGERAVDPVDRVVLAGDQEARTHLRPGRSGVEERRRGVDEVALGHLVVRFQGGRYILAVDAYRDAHEHVLRGLDEFAVNPLEVALLQGFQAEVPEVEVAIALDVFLHLLGHLDDLIGDDAALLELAHGQVEVVRAHLLDVTRGDARREDLVVRVGRDHGDADFGGQGVDLLSGDLIVHAREHLLRDLRGIHVRGEAIRQNLDPTGNIIELHVFSATGAFDDPHVFIPTLLKLFLTHFLQFWRSAHLTVAGPRVSNLRSGWVR